MAQPPTALKLRVRPAGHPAFEVEISRFPVQIGRAPSNDLRLDDPFVSRHHVELTWVGQEVRLTDAGSGNGTFLNGLRTETGMVLKSGDRLRLGNTVLELDSVPGSAAETRPVDKTARSAERKAKSPEAPEPEELAAREVQKRLLPVVAPAIEGYELAFSHHGASRVGGDFLDFLPLPDGRLLVALGDVSGKGLDSALLAANVVAVYRSHAAEKASLVELAAHLNNYLTLHSAPHRYVSLMVFHLDPRRHHLEWVNAGFPPPALVRADGTVEAPAAAGPPLGIHPQVAYEPRHLELGPGDVLLLASDGLLETEGGDGARLGLERLLEVAHRYRGALASELQVLIEQEISGFVGPKPAVDDRSLVVLRRVL